MSLDKNGGWICLHRKIRDNWIWDDPEKLRAWIDILLMVNHEDRQIPFEGHIITIRKGQKLTSLYRLAERWGWTRGRVRRFLVLLEEAEMVTADRTPNGTLLTVENWAFYQDTRNTNEPTGEPTNEPTGEPTNEPTGEPTGDTQTTIINNNNKGNKGEGYIPRPQIPTLPEVRAECQMQGYTAVNPDAFFSYYEARHWKLGGEVINWRSMLQHWDVKDRKKKKNDDKVDDSFWEEMFAKAREEDKCKKKQS